MQSLKATLKVRQSAFDKNYKDVVLDLTNLAENKIDPDRFFSENYITKGMEQLYKAVFGRLDGSAQDGVLKLTQAMGGGKTHNMITIGLLAQYPEYRERVMGSVYKTTFRGAAKVIAFSGRERPNNGIWGYIAEQMGKADNFRHLYETGDAPGQSDWIKLLQGDSVVILLDELPDYLSYSETVQAGLGTLAAKTVRALTTLLNAISKEELSKVVLVISDLQGSYASGSGRIAEIMSDFERETQRIAKNFVPVQQNTNEIYQILRKRLFEQDPDKGTISSVAAAYGQELQRAVKMDLTNESPAKLEAAILESYPFHPSMRELYARFKENPGFMQTRGLIRLMRAIVARMYDPHHGNAERTFLIHPYDIDPNDPDTNTELGGINNKLVNAISNDIASGGLAAAEQLASELGNDLPLRTAKLIFMSSLSAVQSGVKGLRMAEIFANLAAPGSDVSALNAKIIPALRERSWYLHSDSAGNLLYKDVQNISAKVSTYRKTLAQEAIRKEIRQILTKLFAPSVKDVYQELYVLPAVDDIPDERSKVSLVVYQPHQQGGLHPDLLAKYASNRYKNRLLFLTGDHQSMDTIFDNARSIRAAESVKQEMIAEKTPTSDPQYQELENLLDTYQFSFYASVQNVFTKFYYPTKNGMLDANIGLSFNQNKYDGEDQLRKALIDKRKFTTDISSQGFVQQMEHKLFAGQKNRLWSDVLEAAATDTSWLWHKPNSLEQVKQDQVRKDAWRENGSFVQLGPFEQPPTEVQVNVIGEDPKSGKVRLQVKPVRGQVIYYEYGLQVSVNSPVFDLHNTLETDEMLISFLCIDTEEKHKTGEPLVWRNTIKLQRDYEQQGDEFLVKLQATPRHAEIRYSTNGSDPMQLGATYQGPFMAKPQAKILAVAFKGDTRSDVINFDLPKLHDLSAAIKEAEPLKYRSKLAFTSTAEAYQMLGLLQKHNANLYGVEISANRQPHWAALTADADLAFAADNVQRFLEFVQQEMLPSGELSLVATQTLFPSGHAFLQFAKEAQIKYKPTDIEQ